MNRVKRDQILIILALFGLFGYVTACQAAGMSLPGVDIQLDSGGTGDVATAIKILLILTVLSLAPAVLIVMTSFTRIIIVLSMLRQAFGMQQTPPNTVLVSLALFLTLFSMAPVFKQINEQAYTPFMENKLALADAANLAMDPMRKFMVGQTHEADLALLVGSDLDGRIAIDVDNDAFGLRKLRADGGRQAETHRAHAA